MLHRYFIKVPWWIKKIFPAYVWHMPRDEHAVYLTFDDGPHPVVTRWVLEQLKQYGAPATFFCIGSNVAQFPDVYRQIREEGHAIGNHTYHHYNGWETDLDTYIRDVARASDVIDSDLFRPPYGRIKTAQGQAISRAMNKDRVRIIMWDVLSGDFDPVYAPEQCTRNVLRHVLPGSIIVFHDSEKAFPNLKIALPAVLAELKKRGFSFKKL